VESLLKKAVALDPGLGEAYLQLGILYSDQHDFPKAVTAYLKAAEATPRLAEAHYRLGVIYRLMGKTEKAGEQLELFNQLSREASSEVEHERWQVQQFVYELRSSGSGVKPQ